MTGNMPWPYQFVDLTEDEFLQRRVLLDRYGVYAQLSALGPVLVFQLYRLDACVSLWRKRNKMGYTEVPGTAGSPIRKQRRESRLGGLARRWRSVRWWLEGEVYPEWGPRGRWIAGMVWALWLFFLAVHKTGHDYMHVTKRFGHIAASQLPLHYMLPLKSPYSPLAIAFRSSHEQLNAYHRITGRIIYCFLLLHVTFYLNFFAQHGILEKKFKQLVPILGALSITLVTVLAITSMASIRRWSYRVFFVFHIAIAISIVPILFLHAPPLRLYGGEAIAILTIDILLRRLNTVTAVSRITMIEHTELVGLASPIPESKISRFKAAPGQHVYLSIPSSIQFSVPLLSIHQLLFNPFTVAGVSPREILLVLRAQHGPTTTALKQLARLPSTNVSINIEGPYGASRQFPNFTAEFERILLVAGGVGATFILPFYHQITTEMGNEGFSTSKVELVWSMRSMAEANWVTDTKYANIFNGSDRVKIYVTGIESRSSVSRTAVAGHEDVSIEMEDLLRIQPDHVRGGLMRPNLKSIVDKTFHHGLEERVAILVCGPAGMARELREHVGDWIAKGRSVWWHDESFGW